MIPNKISPKKIRKKSNTKKAYQIMEKGKDQTPKMY